MEFDWRTPKNRDDYRTMMLTILNPLKPYYSEKKANLDIGATSAHYANRTIPMEAFIRPLWGLTPYWAGSQESRKKSEDPTNFQNIYIKGIISGTNPECAEYWGKCQDFDQKFVEMAAIAYNMLMAPEALWEHMSRQEQQNLCEWLQEINRHDCPIGNWYFFRVLVNVALKHVNADYDEKKLQEALEVIETLHLGGGWYRDGKGNAHKDYYIAFAFQFYSVIYSMYMQKEDPRRCLVFQKRAMEFGRDFIYWFDADGSAIPYGRSQTYRFAQCAFFSICIVAGIEVFPLSVMKGIVTRHVTNWLSQPIFDHAGILTIGYGYPNLNMSEHYNAPGSPYWCMKAFAFLALPPDHPFWNESCAELPDMEGITFHPNADILIQRSEGHAILFTPGGMLRGKHCHQQPHMEEKYDKFCYSSVFGFSCGRSQMTVEECAPDSVLSFEILGQIFMKKESSSFHINQGILTIHWSPITGIRIKTTIKLTLSGHIREHEIDSKYDCIAYDSGFSVSVDDRQDGIETMQRGKKAEARNQKTFCLAVCREGKGKGNLIYANPNTNLIYSKTVIPSIRYRIQKGKNYLVTKIVYIS
ncbi:DUF2264 domain-containing protein [uncultured Sphaerochaeta sp.]|uniref:DUF2264 domain-containing protein n=1 Tax=uncultured Sphaerochaeta sp. TaxID=886478 RepID=UPI002A0A8DDD|nr:DUF2264 domain-containing protein [uncultured Sphaerochaeta sp.]